MSGEQGAPCPKCYSDLTRHVDSGVKCRECSFKWHPEAESVVVERGRTDGGHESPLRGILTGTPEFERDGFWALVLGLSLTSWAIGVGMGADRAVTMLDGDMATVYLNAPTPEAATMLVWVAIAGSLGLISLGYGIATFRLERDTVGDDMRSESGGVGR